MDRCRGHAMTAPRLAWGLFGLLGRPRRARRLLRDLQRRAASKGCSCSPSRSSRWSGPWWRAGSRATRSAGSSRRSCSFSAAHLGADRLHVDRGRIPRSWRCGSTTGSRTSGSGSSRVRRSRCCSPTAGCPRRAGAPRPGWPSASSRSGFCGRALRRPRARHRGRGTWPNPLRAAGRGRRRHGGDRIGERGRLRRPRADRDRRARRAHAALARGRAPAAEVVRLRRPADACVVGRWPRSA